MTRSTLSLRIAAGAMLLLAVWAPRPVCAQGEPSSIRQLSSRTTLNADELAAIKRYADYWTRTLAEATPTEGAAIADIREIRGKLLEPMRGSSEVFRDAYARVAMPGLEPVIGKGGAQQSVTALIVVSQFGTDRALDRLVRRSAKASEPRNHVRLAAARGVGQTLTNAGETIAAKDVVGAARGVADAAVNEDDPFILRHQVEALLAALERVSGPNREKVTEELVQAIEAAADRAKKAPDGDDALGFLNAVYPVVYKLRARFYVLQEAGGAKKAFGIAFGPCLEKVLDVAEARWAELQNGEGEKSRLGNIIQLCETFLGAIDVVVRAQTAPDTRLKDAWASGDQDRYRRDLQKWRSILSSPPY